MFQRVPAGKRSQDQPRVKGEGGRRVEIPAVSLYLSTYLAHKGNTANMAPPSLPLVRSHPYSRTPAPQLNAFPQAHLRHVLFSAAERI